MKLRDECPTGDRPAQPERMALPRGGLLRMESGSEPRRVFCAFGGVWITVEGSPADIFLRSGDSINLPARGLVIAEALVDSALEIQDD